MNWIITIYIALLFFALTPGVLVSLPPKKGKYTVAAVHAVIFAAVWHFTHRFVKGIFMPFRREGVDGEKEEEGFEGEEDEKKKDSENFEGEDRPEGFDGEEEEKKKEGMYHEYK